MPLCGSNKGWFLIRAMLQPVAAIAGQSQAGHHQAPVICALCVAHAWHSDASCRPAQQLGLINISIIGATVMVSRLSVARLLRSASAQRWSESESCIFHPFD